MAKPTKPKTKDLSEIELHPDAWKRFENFVDTNVRKGPAPTPKATPSRPKAASRKRPKKA